MALFRKKMLFAAWSCHNTNYFAYQTWHKPLKHLFSSFVTFDPQEYIYKHGREAMNKAFLDVVAKEQPDYIYFWLIYDEFYIETLAQIKKISPHTKTINFFGDDDTLFTFYTRYYALFIDYPLASHQLYLDKYKRDGLDHMFFSCGVDTALLKPLKIPKKYDVSFVGTPKKDRADYLRFLKANGISIALFGSGWQAYPEFKGEYKGKLSQQEATKVINQSRVNLSFTKNYKGFPGFKARIFEIAACKSFVLSEYFEGYRSFLNEQELIMFRTPEELLSLVTYYLTHTQEREAIAQRAYKQVVPRYSQEEEFKRIFKSILADKGYSGRKLPSLSGSYISLTAKDLALSEKALKEKVGEVEYILFTGDKQNDSLYRAYMQEYSLLKTGASVSCCDYHLTSKGLGHYLSFFAGHASQEVPFHEWVRCIPLETLFVRKTFFIAHLSAFRSYLTHREGILSLAHMGFVGIPLTALPLTSKDIPSLAHSFLYAQFDNELRHRMQQKTLPVSPYAWRVAFQALHEPFVRQQLMKHIRKKL